MSENNIYGLPKIDLTYSGCVNDRIEKEKRRLAVEAALEIIRAGSLGGKDALDYMMGDLSKYADKIEAALEVKSDK